MSLRASASPQVTTNVPVPGSVLIPIFQLQLTTPVSSAVSRPRPRALLWVPLGVVYSRSHSMPGVVCTVADASSPGAAPVTVVKVTPEPDAGVDSTGVAVAPKSSTMVAGGGSVGVSGALVGAAGSDVTVAGAVGAALWV